MNRWVEVLDHGDDPGRYTVVHGDGRILTVNENGTLICQRKCHNPRSVVWELSREPGIRVMKPALVPALLKKMGLTVYEEKPLSSQHPSPTVIPDEVRARLIAYARRKWPDGDSYHARVSWQGNYVVGFSNDYPLQHGPGQEQTLTPRQYEDLDTILDKTEE